MTSRKPQAINDLKSIEEDQSDPFLDEALSELDTLENNKTAATKRIFTSGRIFLSSVLLLLILALGLSADGLIRSLFAEYQFLGFIALIITIDPSIRKIVLRVE